MASYHFPIIIGSSTEERIVMVHLFDTSTKNYEEKRVIFTDTNNPLFTVRKDLTIVSENGQTVAGEIFTDDDSDNSEQQPLSNNDMGVLDSVKKFLGNINKWLSTENSFDNQGHTKQKAGNTPSSKTKIQVSVKVNARDNIDDDLTHSSQENNSAYTCCSLKTNIHDGNLLQIIFNCSINDTQYSGTLNVIVCTQANIGYTTIDLGSDATQIYLSLGGTQSNSVNFLDELISKDLSHISSHLQTHKEYLSQHYPGKNFYKTGNIVFKENGELEQDYINYLSINIEGENAIDFKNELYPPSPTNTGSSSIQTNTANKTKDTANETKDTTDKTKDTADDTKDTADKTKDTADKTKDTADKTKDTADKTKDTADDTKDNKHLVPLSFVECVKAKVKVKTYPNIKVLYRGNIVNGSYVYPYRLDGISQPANAWSILPILTSIYKKIVTTCIKEKYMGAGGNVDPIKLRSVLILVPNIYKQLHVEELLYELTKTMNTKIPNDANTYYDFRVISESDAAFLGNKPNDDPQRELEAKDYYLLIDSGRGTTDFSIIQKCKDNSFLALDRGGLVGAGNAIDFVFTLIYANHLKEKLSVTHDKISNDHDFTWHFIEWLNSLSPEIKEKIRLSIESMKTSYNNTDNSCQWEPDLIFEDYVEGTITDDNKRDAANNHTSGDIFNKNTVVSETLTISKEEVSMINNLCKSIAEGILSNFQPKSKDLLKKIDYVIYTGRSFKFEPLKDAFEELLDKNRSGNSRGIRTTIQNVLINKSSHGNLNSANQNGDSKENTIKFANHNFNINLNSDLCCIPEFLADFATTDFSIEQLFNGLDIGGGKKRYYIGYHGGRSVFTNDSGNQGTQGYQPSELTYMSIYPEIPDTLLTLNTFNNIISFLNK